MSSADRRQCDEEVQSHFPNKSWIDTGEMRELAWRVNKCALQTVYEAVVDSGDVVDFTGPPFSLEVLQRWFPEREDVPPERFTSVSLHDLGQSWVAGECPSKGGVTDDDWSRDSFDGSVTEEPAGDQFRDVEGRVCHPGTEEMRQIAAWEEEWGSPEPPPRPELPSLFEWAQAVAKFEEEKRRKKEDARVAAAATRTYAQAAQTSQGAGPSAPVGDVTSEGGEKTESVVGRGDRSGDEQEGTQRVEEQKQEDSAGQWQAVVGRRTLRRRRKGLRPQAAE